MEKIINYYHYVGPVGFIVAGLVILILTWLVQDTWKSIKQAWIWGDRWQVILVTTILLAVLGTGAYILTLILI
jgi:hypothetical protein